MLRARFYAGGRWVESSAGTLDVIEPATGAVVGTIADGEPDDVAQAALYLASAEFITDVALPVDGGRTI